MMEIIQPAHNKISKSVDSWKQIEADAKQMLDAVRGGKFKGNWPTAFSLSHSYVSQEPLNFFVINDEIEEGALLKQFGTWCIINPKVFKFADPVFWKEACMAYPFRSERKVDRFNKILVEYQMPVLGRMMKVKKYFSGVAAFIVQHELDHSVGKNIYGLGQPKK